MELHIRNLSKTYANGVHALKDITLTIPPRHGLPGLSPTKALTYGSCCCEYSCHIDPSTGKMHCACAIPPGCMTAQRCFSTGEL